MQVALQGLLRPKTFQLMGVVGQRCNLLLTIFLL